MMNTSSPEHDTPPDARRDGLAALEANIIEILGPDGRQSFQFEYGELAGGKVICVDVWDSITQLFVARAFCHTDELTPEVLAASLRMSIYLGRGDFSLTDGL